MSSLAGLAQTDVTTPIPSSLLAPALSSPPFLTLPGTFNTRDLGLIPGSPIKPGLIYRSGGFFMAGPSLPSEAKTILSDKLKIKKVFDLRSVREHGQAPDPDFGQGIEGVWEKPDELDAVVELSEFVEGLGENGYVSMYADVLKVYHGAIRKVLEAVRDGECPILFHCTAGRDRTGVVAGIILTLAGASPEVIALDFMLTRIGYEPAREQLIAFALKGSSAENTEVPGFHNLINLSESCWEAFVKAAEVAHGGLEGYVKGTLGFSEEEVSKIRDNLVVRN
ncbi:tyrosine-protein phosphatase [Cladorrhinum sp. PSN332]|nr:tyrosine-protein phosphatase [Cladorrhinum sp. PSN332]